MHPSSFKRRDPPFLLSLIESLKPLNGAMETERVQFKRENKGLTENTNGVLCPVVFFLVLSPSEFLLYWMGTNLAYNRLLSVGALHVSLSAVSPGMTSRCYQDRSWWADWYLLACLRKPFLQGFSWVTVCAMAYMHLEVVTFIGLRL